MPPSRSSRSTRSRKNESNIDLNAAAPVDDQDQVGISMCSNPHLSAAAQGVAGAPAVPIDLEEFDDDVIISSPRAFAEAKNKSQRNHERAAVDSGQGIRHKRRRTSLNQRSMNDEIYINLEASGNSTRVENGISLQQTQLPPPPPPPKEPTFNCPVCIGPLEEEMTTKCGHIFCKKCITNAILHQKKCPTCRKKISTRDIFRVYLPAAST